MPRISVFIASSIDNYIATDDDRLDWLESAAKEGEDYGYGAFMSTVDGMAMGRGTWNHIESIDPLPFGERKLFVFTHRPPRRHRPGVTFWEHNPREALDEWTSLGLEHVYLDGGQLISSFLAEGLVDDFLLTKIPILLGSGKPLFTRIDRRTALSLEEVESFPSGIVNLRYSRF
jgi:dihydrofolate reductase